MKEKIWKIVQDEWIAEEVEVSWTKEQEKKVYNKIKNKVNK